jgi:hypothetical protein
MATHIIAVEHRPPKRPWLASVPLLRIFVTPETPELTADKVELGTGASAVRPDAPPWTRPGSALRGSTRAGRTGWYAPALVGAPSTTRQAEILNTALIGPPTGTAGVVNGRDHLSRTTISHDAPTAYNSDPRQITSPNVLAFGTVGSGKSSFVKTVCVIRPLLLKNRRAVVFDKKDENGEGEYAALTRRMGSEPFRFTADGSGTRLNLMDPLITRGTGLQGQTALLNAVARIARNDTPSTEWERKAIRDALKLTFEHFDGGRVPTPADLLPNLGHIADDGGELSSAARDRLHMAGLSIRYAIEDLMDEYGGLLDGETSAGVDLAHKLTTFDISALPDDGPAIPVVMAIGNMWLMGRLRHERGSVTNVIYEEGWHMIGGPSAHLIKANQKLSRSLGISNVFVMHKGTDIPPESPGYTVIQEAQTIYVFNQARAEDANWAVSTFGFAPETATTLVGLAPGHLMFKYGSNPETHIQHVRSIWETEVTNTDSALSAAE